MQAVHQGLQTIHQNIQNAGATVAHDVANKAVQGAQKFVDTAGNVYTVIKDASGSATNFVMDAAGMIYDVTKMAGTFLLDNALNYPNEIKKSAQQTAQDLQNLANTAKGSTQALLQFAKNSRPNLPPVGKDMLHPSAWMNAAKQNAVKMSSAYDQLSTTYTDYFTQFENKYCIPASFTPATKKPGTLYGPGFQLEIGLGGCVVANHDYHNKTMSLDCIEPYVSWKHVPAEFIPKYISPPIFISKECKIQKTHGTTDEITLVTFNGHQAPNAQTLTSAVQSQLQAALSGLTNAGHSAKNQVSNFLNGLNQHEKNSLNALVKSYEGMPQPQF